MKKLLLGLSIAALVTGGQIVMGQGQSQGQGLGPNNDPFFDRSDTGEIIHVLPPEAAIHSPRDTQPTFAPPEGGTAVYSASYGSGNLTDHGGPEISNATFQPIYWNAAVANSAGSQGYATLRAQINGFAAAFSSPSPYSGATTDDYAIVQQYGSSNTIASNLGLNGDKVDSRAAANNIKDSSIRSYIASVLGTHTIPVGENILYGVYFPAGMKVLLAGGTSCSSFCGYHSHFTYNGLQIKYAVFPYLNCSACKLSALAVADMLTIVTSHEIREAVTDPGDNNQNAWYDASGYEADDKCAWHNLYQMTNGGFWVQPEFSNGGGIYPGPGCVVPNRNVPKPAAQGQTKGH